MERCIHDLLRTECGICNGALARQNARPPSSSERCADAIFDLIPIEGYISNPHLAELTGLTGPQVAAGVAYLRDNYPEMPLVSGREGYSFTLKEADVNRFRLARQRAALTIYRRLWRGVIRPLVATMEPEKARYTTRAFERLLEDLEDMIA